MIIRKNLGQNFLTDKHWRQRIGEACSPAPNKHFIEVGPGKVLSGLIKRISSNFDIKSINEISDLDLND